MFLQHRQRIGGETLQGQAIRPAVNLKKVFAQKRYVGDAFAQRWKMNGYDVNPIVEVFTETPRPRHLFQRLVGGRDKPEVDSARGASAQALNLVILKHAQQLGLQGQRKRRNLVQKKRAAIGQFNVARPRFGGPGKRAALAAEQLRLDQILWQRRAVQPDEWLVGSDG